MNSTPMYVCSYLGTRCTASTGGMMNTATWVSWVEWVMFILSVGIVCHLSLVTAFTTLE